MCKYIFLIIILLSLITKNTFSKSVTIFQTYNKKTAYKKLKELKKSQRNIYLKTKKIKKAFLEINKNKSSKIRKEIKSLSKTRSRKKMFYHFGPCKSLSACKKISTRLKIKKVTPKII